MMTGSTSAGSADFSALPRAPQLDFGAALADAAPQALEVHDDRHHQRHQEAGHDGRDEQRADRDARERAVDDEPEARRDHVGEDRGRAGQRDAERLGIAAPLHRRHHGLGDRRGIRRRGAGHAAHQRVGQHVDVPEPAAEMTDQRGGERDELFGDAADIHHAGRQHEERDREQQVVERIHHALRHGQQRELALRQERHEGAEDQRVDDRHAGEHQADRHDDERPDHAERADQGGTGGALEREVEHARRRPRPAAAPTRCARLRSARAPARRARSRR